jgi:hypothetical protein
MHSVLHGTFIDPDYIHMPLRRGSNSSLFYWLEWPARGPTPRTACATSAKGDLQVLLTDSFDRLWYTDRRVDGSWPDPVADVQNKVPGDGPEATTWVACATDLRRTAPPLETSRLHVLVIDESGGSGTRLAGPTARGPIHSRLCRYPVRIPVQRNGWLARPIQGQGTSMSWSSASTTGSGTPFAMRSTTAGRCRPTLCLRCRARAARPRPPGWLARPIRGRATYTCS